MYLICPKRVSFPATWIKTMIRKNKIKKKNHWENPKELNILVCLVHAQNFFPKLEKSLKIEKVLIHNFLFFIFFEVQEFLFFKIL